MYEESRSVLKTFLENVVKEAVTYTEYLAQKDGLRARSGWTANLECKMAIGDIDSDSAKVSLELSRDPGNANSGDFHHSQ